MLNYVKPSSTVSQYHPISSGSSSGSSGASSKGSSGGGGGNGYGHQGANNDKQRRYEYNSLKRSGDWGALNTPPWLLWVDALLCADDELECLQPVITDLWP